MPDINPDLVLKGLVDLGSGVKNIPDQFTGSSEKPNFIVGSYQVD